MNRVIIGFGNSLRGEDAFGIDVITGLEKVDLSNTKLISTFQLTPELVLELTQFDEIVFVDACYSSRDHYSLACSIVKHNNTNLSHHISIQMIISMLNNLYNKYPTYRVYSMITSSFDEIIDKNRYENSINKVINSIKKQL